jgi:hypothetical protein
MAASCGLMCFRARAKNRNHHREHSSTAGRVPLWSVLLGVRRLLRMGIWDNEDAVWSLFGIHDVKLMNPAKVLLVAAANTMAVICFVAGGTIAWHPTVTMLIAASLGGYLEARLTLMLITTPGRDQRPELRHYNRFLQYVHVQLMLPTGDVFDVFRRRTRDCSEVLTTCFCEVPIQVTNEL